MYSQAGAGQAGAAAGAGGPDTGSHGGDDVVDAEFRSSDES
jgi:hypothetical protein